MALPRIRPTEHDEIVTVIWNLTEANIIVGLSGFFAFLFISFFVLGASGSLIVIAMFLLCAYAWAMHRYNGKGAPGLIMHYWHYAVGELGIGLPHFSPPKRTVFDGY